MSLDASVKSDTTPSQTTARGCLLFVIRRGRLFERVELLGGGG
jgi:hypothetical protein